MTARHTGVRAHETAVAVRVRADSAMSEEDLAYLREKVDTVLGRPGLPPVSGEIRIGRAPAAHAGQPWTAGAEIRVGHYLVVVHAREHSARELADRLQDRLRSRTDRVAHRAHCTRRTATPPPWRGGEET
ncbi:MULTISPECIES: hypothetical protein [unclassified Streptomyces]|uniref:hypothetical protein n=1 Tax=unclassified Streptomyces TaxID=2593676 RepID=UPI000DBA1889|nr:hypothetical protein [Streptomyces sp. PsTaAH-130]MYU08093.1 hypothetical protein [Streptomyces sp. SID8366]MYU62063.1 hypothetical protein [Streptomyces sp. SID69]RAJ59290.1 hypothetical protein K376_03051 [Streptomyces sp. PsTaAH-130]